MLQIKIEQTNRIEKETGLTCLDDCIATLAHYYGCHYEMMYADGFAILGNGCECRFASSYFIRLVNGPSNLTDYHGLTLHKKGPFTKRRMKKLIRDEIEEGLRSLIDELAYRDNIFNEVPSDELFWRSPLVGILLRMNQSIQSISGFVRYVAGELENEDLMALGERIWNLAITWKQGRKLITKLYLALGDENKGILYTGDLGYKDNEGFLYIRGRKSRFGKVYGKRIDLAYLEIQLECELQIHAVLLSDDKKIFIYTDSGKWQSAAKYIQLKTGFPSHVLECKELAELPRNESGKVRRHLCSIYH